MHVFYALLTVTHSKDWLLPGNQNTRDFDQSRAWILNSEQR